MDKRPKKIERAMTLAQVGGGGEAATWGEAALLYSKHSDTGFLSTALQNRPSRKVLGKKQEVADSAAGRKVEDPVPVQT